MEPLPQQQSAADFLPTVEILSPFTRAELERLADAAESRFYAFGDTVCQTGEPALGLYVIKSGSVRVFSDDHGKEVSMGVRKAGEVFAEIAMRRDHRHEVSVRASVKTEDLGSTNGTFVDGVRLEEHAVALTEGSTVAFGGHHFIYRVGAQWDEPAIDPTVTRLGIAAATPAIDTDKTTFMAAADSFLDIFCVEPPQEEPRDEAAEATASEAAPPARTARPPPSSPN